MTSVTFKQIAGRLTRADNLRRERNKGSRTRPLVLGIALAAIAIALLGGVTVFGALYVNGWLWIGGPILMIFVLFAIYRTFFGRSGFLVDDYEQHRDIAVLFSESRTLLQALPSNEAVVVFGLDEINEEKLSLISPATWLTPDMVSFTAIKADARIPMGEYKWLGFAGIDGAGRLDISDEECQRQGWLAAAKAAGKSDSEIRAFLHSLKLPVGNAPGERLDKVRT